MQWIVPGFVAFFGVVQNSPRNRPADERPEGRRVNKKAPFLRKGKERNKEGIDRGKAIRKGREGERSPNMRDSRRDDDAKSHFSQAQEYISICVYKYSMRRNR